jgi:hypothetical protein
MVEKDCNLLVRIVVELFRVSCEIVILMWMLERLGDHLCGFVINVDKMENLCY